MRQRKSLAHVDDKAKRRKVADTRKHIYEKNLAVNSDAVKRLLKDQSLVPTDVSSCPRMEITHILTSSRMHSLEN